MDLINLADFEARAREKLPKMAYDYYASGAWDEITLHENHRAYDRIQLHPRMLIDVSQRDLSTSVLHQKISMPIMIAPTAFHGMAHADAEMATARAAQAAGTILTLSTLSNTAVEDVAQAAQGSLWFQLYVYKDKSATEDLVRRVEAAGAKALVLTVDAPYLGRRERDVRNRFHLPEGLSIENMSAAGMGELGKDDKDSGLAVYIAKVINPAMTWKDVEWLRSITELPVLIKGVLRADDALKAVDAGVAGIVISNHGGRQLDTAPATIEVLPRIAEEVNGRIEILIDGGIRRGTDVIKAIALGAKAVLIGRPVVWGLAVDGEQGVTRVLNLLRAEVDLVLAMCGCRSRISRVN
ncbi:MAG TPA: alpha-hydroxy acid oxidase [Anaerolineae bacterium]|nr:alpha-hydroxy acid oxidase [Anaerolineae bacterium]